MAETILTSLLTSIIVSLFTYILGLKSGKNQADRAMLQSLYKKMYAHFDDLEDFLQRNRPKTWRHYKVVKYDLNKKRSIPVISEMKMNGELLSIKPSIAEYAYELENELMDYGYSEFENMRVIHQVICSATHLFMEGCGFETYSGQAKDAHFKTSNPTECKSFYETDYRDWYDKDKIREWLVQLDNNHAISFRYQGDDCYTIMLYPHGISVPIEQFIEEIYQALECEIIGFEEHCSKKAIYIKKIEKLKRKLAKLAREPFSFWGTFFGAFGDLFK